MIVYFTAQDLDREVMFMRDSEIIYESLTEIDDDLIEKAQQPLRPKDCGKAMKSLRTRSSRGRIRYLLPRVAVVACICTLMIQAVLATSPTLREVTTDYLRKVRNYETSETGFGGGVSFSEEEYAYVYDGDEVRLTYRVSSQAYDDLLMEKDDSRAMGVMLFVDGYPQAYRVVGGDDYGDESYAYMHVFGSDTSDVLEYEFCFVPVTGSAGDTLELWSMAMWNPEYFAEGDYLPHYHTGSSGMNSPILPQNDYAYLVIEEDVPLAETEGVEAERAESDGTESEEAEVADATDAADIEDTENSKDESSDIESNDSADTESDSHEGDGADVTEESETGTNSDDPIISYEISYQEAQIVSSDIANGLMTPAFTVNGEEGPYIYDLTDEGTAALQFSFYGTSNVTYELTLFVNNSPVFFDGEPLEINLQSGQMTILEIEYDMSDFDGETFVYAVLAPKNYIAARAKGLVENTGCLRASPTLYLTSAGSYEELRGN
ncbi:MAG: hypothetical protein LUE29_09180 [Lachnospiraceae bacterium]|nr:hypothetical protein [Lachnospiraceae bacterium]